MTIEEILKLRQEAGGLNKLMHMHVVTLDKDGGATVEVELTYELLNPLALIVFLLLWALPVLLLADWAGRY